MLFDEVVCEIPLREWCERASPPVLQTRDLACGMDRYRIDKEGVIWLRIQLGDQEKPAYCGISLSDFSFTACDDLNKINYCFELVGQKCRKIWSIGTDHSDSWQLRWSDNAI